MIVVCVVILAVHSNCQPYMRARANVFESVYLLVLCVLAVVQVVPDIMVNDNKDAVVYTSVVLLGLTLIHTTVVFFYKAVRFFRGRFECCAGGEVADGRRRGRYRELEDSRTEQIVDAEVERRRHVLDMIFNTRARQESRCKSKLIGSSIDYRPLQ